MSSLDDLIRFDIPENWELVISQTRTAEKISEAKHYPIPPFDLGISLTSPYVLIVIQTTEKKSTWKYGGEVRQNWDFPKGSSIGTLTGIAQSEPTQLSLDRTQLVELNPSSLHPYQLRYQPPYWFKDVIVFGWVYTGTVQNFVKDTLFEIGNKVGIGTLNLPDNIPNILKGINERLGKLELLLGLSNPQPDNPKGTVPPDDFEDFNNLGIL